MKAIAAVHVGLKQLGIDDATGRDLYERVTGKRSLAAMTETEINRVVQELRDKGFKPATKGARRPLEGKFVKKLQALWIAAWNLGLVKNRDDEALIAFVKRQTKLDHVRFLRDADDARKAIEALKAWMARSAGVNWTDDFGWVWLKSESGKIAAAQWSLLHQDVEPKTMFSRYAWLVLRKPPMSLDLDTEPTAAEWIVIMNSLGELVREAKKNGRQ